MPFLPRRILETFLAEGAISAAFTFLFRTAVLLSTRNTVIAAMLLALVINFILLFIFCRGYILSIRKLKIYYRVNMTVMVILTAVSVAVAYIDIEPIFTWAFFPFKLFYFWLGLDKALSALAVGGMFILVTALIPLFVRKPVNIYAKPE